VSNEEVELKKYSRGHRKIQMLRACAEQKGTWDEIASRFGISVTALYQWRKRNEQDIADLRAGIIDACDTLWIADKTNRVAEYQAHVERIDELVDNGAEQPQVLLKVAQSALRSVAEELGHLSPKDTGEATKIDVRIVGVDGGVL
jgi:transposase-like protein